MANEVCVFCGQKPGTFRSTTVTCGLPIVSPAANMSFTIL